MEALLACLSHHRTIAGKRPPLLPLPAAANDKHDGDETHEQRKQDPEPEPINDSVATILRNGRR